jgi:CRP-like cAMP-binding protein
MPDGSAFDRLHLFRDLNPAQAALVRSLFTPCHEAAGNFLFEQGDAAEFLYLIVVGEVAIRYKPEDGAEIVLSHVRPEGLVGWSAALGNSAYTSSAVCVADCLLLRARGQDLRRLCERNPEIGSLVLERLAAVVAERLSGAHDQVVALLEHGLRVNNKSLHFEGG